MVTPSDSRDSSNQKSDPNDPLTQPDPIGASGSILKPKPGLSPNAPMPTASPAGGMAPLPMAPASTVPTPTTQLATTQMAASAPGAGPVPTPTGQLASSQMAATSAGPAPSGAMGSLPTPTGYYSDQLAGAKPGPLNDAGYTPSTYTAPQLVNGQATPSAPTASAPPPLYPGGATLPDGTPLMQGADIYKYTQGLLDQMNPAPGTFLSDADFAKKQRIGQLQSGAGSGGNPMTMDQIQAFINNGTPAETNREIVSGSIPQSYFGTPSGGSAAGTTSAPSAGTSAGTPGQNPTGNSTLNGLLNGAATSGGSVKTTPTDPNNPLTAQTLSVGDTTDPVKQAMAAWDTFRQSTDPQYQAALRDANRMAAAGGAIGSGALNTSLGDIASTRANALDTARQSLLENALGTKNENAYRDVGIAQQQQGFQNQQQQQAFGNALQQLLAGSSGDPSQIMLALAGLYGGQATAGGQAAAGLGASKAGNQSTGSVLAQLLGSLGGGGSGGGSSAAPSGIDDILGRGIPGGYTTAGAY